MEYIEREALWRAFEYEPFYDNADRDEIVLPKIDSFPAADVAHVRHAKWEVVIGSDGKEHMVCTGCRKQQDLTGVFSYCPNCGAKMDGGDSNE